MCDFFYGKCQMERHKVRRDANQSSKQREEFCHDDDVDDYQGSFEGEVASHLGHRYLYGCFRQHAPLTCDVRILIEVKGMSNPQGPRPRPEPSHPVRDNNPTPLREDRGTPPPPQAPPPDRFKKGG